VARTKTTDARHRQVRRLGKMQKARRRRVVGLVLIVAGALITIGLLAMLASGHRRQSDRPSGRPAAVTVKVVGRSPLVLSRAEMAAGGLLHLDRLTTWLSRRLPVESVEQHGQAHIVYRYDAAATAEVVLDRARQGGGSAAAVRDAVGAVITAPVLRQVLRNDCEATALSVLLASSGKRVEQLALQGRLARSGPLDPKGSGPTKVWGDPELGFVGRADGRGTEGGFGVYEQPVAALAAREGRPLTNLTGRSVAEIYAHLLHGHAVMAWVALSNGPYATWRSPSGRSVQVNYGEHTVTLVGAGPGELRVVNPLSGQLERWPRSRFESAWKRMGRRALAL